MSTPPQETFTKTAPIADADGVAIRVGSVLREISDGEQGVVVEIVGADAPSTFGFLMGLGDIRIRTSCGSYRVTNRHSAWRHVPHNEQSYEERYHSWLRTPYDHDDEEGVSKDEGKAIDGILAILPDDAVNWDYGPIPNKLEDALDILVRHLSETKIKPSKPACR